MASRTAGVVALAYFTWGGACAMKTLDAGHDNPPDACAPLDGGASCTPKGLLDNLVGYWRLDDGTGSTTAFDSSGRGNEGMLRNLDVGTAWIAGRAQGGLAIAHTGWVQVAPSPSINSITDHLTVSAWVDMEGPIDLWATVLSRQIGTGKDQYYHLSLGMDGHPTLLVTTPDGFAPPAAPDVAQMGTWTHLAGTYDGATARLYVNGVEVASKPLTGALATDTTPVILGGNGNDASGVPTELFPGRIDELMLYARALDAPEIAALAAGALFPAGARDAGAD
jgi:hypothetical protein